MKNKLKDSLGIVLIIMILAFIIIGVIGGLLKLLGIQSRSTVSLVGFLVVYMAIGWLVDTILTACFKAGCDSLGIPLAKGFYGFLVCDFLLELFVLKGLDKLIASVVVPMKTAVLFALCFMILNYVIEKKEPEWISSNS